MQLQTKYENILNQFEKNDAVKSNQAAEKLKVETLDMGNFFSNGDTPKKTGICPLLRVKWHHMGQTPDFRVFPFGKNDAILTYTYHELV